jgi:Uncharacterised nucleotidyltransferase
MTNDLMSPLFAALQRGQALPRFTLPQWESVMGQARQTRLLGRLATAYADQQALASLETGPQRYLQSALHWVARQHREVRWEVDRIERALADIDTPIVLLKGAAYLMADLPPARGRLFADIDIMVERGHIAAVEDALFAAGWISGDRDAYTQRYYREWMHELPPLQHVHRHTVIDVHHTIAPPTSRFAVEGQRLLQRCVALKGSKRLHVLDPLDMVLHSAVHLFQEGEFDHGLRDLLDMNDLVLHFSASAGFWEALFARAVELGMQVPLYHALVHLQRLFGTAPPAGEPVDVDALRPSWLGRRVMGALLSRALRPMHPSCRVPQGAPARWLLYVRSHYLRMPMHLVLPHLARKAWMRQFAKPEGEQDALPGAPKP